MGPERLLVIFSLLLLTCTVCFTQTRVNTSGTGGLNTIQGQIFTANGRMIDSSITVRLQSVTDGELTLITDQNGGFVFKNLSAGTYQIVVTAGDEFETVRESISIDPDLRGPNRVSTPKTFSVPIYLQPKRSGKQKNGVVNANTANASKAAVKHYESGMALEKANKPAEAISEFDQAVHIDPSFVLVRLELGKLYLKLGKLAQAIESLLAANALEPKNFDIEVNLGIAFLARNDHVQAGKSLTEAAEINSSALTPHYYLGLMFIQEKKLDLAQKELETAEQLNGADKFPLLHRCLGGIYLAKSLKPQAVKELETYLALAPAAKDADRIRQTIAGLRSNNPN